MNEGKFTVQCASPFWGRETHQLYPKGQEKGSERRKKRLSDNPVGQHQDRLCSRRGGGKEAAAEGTRRRGCAQAAGPVSLRASGVLPERRLSQIKN